MFIPNACHFHFRFSLSVCPIYWPPLLSLRLTDNNNNPTAVDDTSSLPFHFPLFHVCEHLHPISSLSKPVLRRYLFLVTLADFDMEEFYTAPSSTQSGHKNTQDDDIMELVWRNGQIGVQNHNHGVVRKSSPPLKSQEQEQLNQPPSEQPPPGSNSATQLYIQEDEMTSWLHYPLDDDTSFDRNLTDLLYHPPPPPPTSVAPSLALPPADLRPPLARPPPPQPAVRVNFPHFARLKARVPEAGQSASSSRNNDLRDSAVVDSNDTPKSSLLPELSSAVKVSGGEAIGGSGSTVGDGGGYMTLSRDAETCNLTLTSFGGSVSGATPDLMTQPPADDRKRKGREPESQSEDLEIESCEARRQCPGSSSGKRSRATEVHNLSERKRRDRINERMKALQELIPRCCKTDKASMLDEAIEYLKSLQMQLQMMSMGYYGMFPMMFPGVQQYMPPVPPMGVGRGMETGISRPMVPFPSVLNGSQMATPGAPSALGPRFPFPSFPAPPVPVFDPARAQTNPMEMPTSADLYRQYLAALQMPVQQLSQNRPASTPSSSKPSSSREAEDNENCPSGTG